MSGDAWAFLRYGRGKGVWARRVGFVGGYLGGCLVVTAAQGSRTGVGNGEVVGVMALEVYSKFYRGQ